MRIALRHIKVAIRITLYRTGPAVSRAGIQHRNDRRRPHPPLQPMRVFRSDRASPEQALPWEVGARETAIAGKFRRTIAANVSMLSLS